MHDTPWLLFGGRTYYADGGMRDFLGCFAEHEEAEALASALVAEADGDGRWAHIVHIHDLRSFSFERDAMEVTDDD